MSTITNDTTPATGIVYDPQTGDYIVRLNGTLLGYAPHYGIAHARLTAAQADHDFALCACPLDCADLAATFRQDRDAAARTLISFTPSQLNLQALAYAAYVSELHGLDLAMDDVLANWQRGIARMTERRAA